MPFDGLPQGWLDDMAKLRTALEGVRERWRQNSLGLDTSHHCAIGWLLIATDGDRDETTRLALEYVYPALPKGAKSKQRRIDSIWRFNDEASQASVVRVFERAVAMAEQAVR